MRLDRHFYLRGAALVSAGGLLLTLLGPFGSYLNGPFHIRLLFWMSNCWIGLLLYGAIIHFLLGRWRSSAVDWSALLLGTLFASIPQSWISRAMALHIWPRLKDHFPSPLLWYGQTIVIGVLFVLIGVQWSIRRQSAMQPEELPEQDEVLADPFFQPAAIIALQIEDHYVRVHRIGGSQIILMPLKQAIGRMNEVDGIQTHRSWWVAKAAVTEVKGTPRNMRLRLSNGLEAPVARSAVIKLREAAWL
ncbi:LytTR family DNA-binding domain-containing protein [Novosphingobium naphthalenivorans]|uniref:LytTR family DNA-binding domain-containing protein n=1 Tax=Novosphingobium naphthalenivorans TaxID=273168 RepID=UPI00082EE0F7|nr:LytTR family DNA-binding domain-containing protein [Novosphingobium naphthalenivorans]